MRRFSSSSSNVASANSFCSWLSRSATVLLSVAVLLSSLASSLSRVDSEVDSADRPVSASRMPCGLCANVSEIVWKLCAS